MLAGTAWEKLRFIAAPLCDCCGLPFEIEAGPGTLCLACIEKRPPYRSARAALAYDEESRKMILGFKHGDQTHITHSFTPWLRRAGRDMLGGADLIMPVPLHRWRLLRRRYNQSALLAATLARATGKTWLPDTLRRVRATESQGFKRARERRANVRRAFIVPEKQKHLIKGRAIVLVDDVYTTGATVQECTKTLLAAGAASVDVLTIARTVRD